MQNTKKLGTQELIDRLLQEEDRVSFEAIQELAQRGEEAASRLREILTNEDYWYEGNAGEHYMVIHAINALSLMRDEASLPLLLAMLEHSYFANHDAANEVYPAALAHFSTAAVEPLKKYIRDLRGAHRDNQDWAQCRHDAMAALVRIATEDPEQLPGIRDFLLELFNDPTEDDFVFLSFSAAYPFVLAKEQGLAALRSAYERRAISPSITGTYRELMTSINNPASGFYHDLQSEIEDFYTPEAISDRAKARAEAAAQKLYWGYDDNSVLKGYAVAESGNVVRTDKVGRNDPCPCGSGKKYKKCCGQGG